MSLPPETAQFDRIGVDVNGKILIVEDEFLVALQLEDILSDEGYSVIGTVPDLASLHMLNEAPDVALVDLNLRDGLSGPDIARELASRFATKVVYVTANANQIGLPAETAIGVVQKPFSKDAILGAIGYALDATDPACRPPELEPVDTVRH